MDEDQIADLHVPAGFVQPRVSVQQPLKHFYLKAFPPGLLQVGQVGESVASTLHLKSSILLYRFDVCTADQKMVWS